MTNPARPTSTLSKTLGWVFSGLLAAFMVFSLYGKFFDFPGKSEMFEKLGWSESIMPYIGYLELFVTILFLIPRTAFLGAILVTAYLGGAIATHVRINEDFSFPIAIGVLFWVALGLRDWRIFQLALGGRSEANPPPTAS